VLPELADVYDHTGQCLLLLDRHETAIDSCDRGIALLPRSPRLAAMYANRGNARAALSEIDGAIADFTRAAEILPELSEVMQKQRARVERSRPTAAPARREPLYDERDALPAGWELDQCGDVVGALIAFGTAIERAPSASAYYARGVANCKLRRYPEAIADLDRALELRPARSPDPRPPVLRGRAKPVPPRSRARRPGARAGLTPRRCSLAVRSLRLVAGQGSAGHSAPARSRARWSRTGTRSNSLVAFDGRVEPIRWLRGRKRPRGSNP
jgi:tetratricopeptide (TPR) repeat protein